MGSDTATPSTGRTMCGSPTMIGSSKAPRPQMQQDVGFEREYVPLRGAEGDPSGNTSRILMTGLRRPGQRGATTWVANWVRPIIPNRLMMLLSGTDNRRNRSEGYSVRSRITSSEVKELQCRPREYMRQQLEQMDDWDRAFHREWTISYLTQNALAFPYPMGDPVGRESEAQTLMATPIRGYMRLCRKHGHIRGGGRNFGGWNDNIRTDPNYSSLPGLEIRNQYEKKGVAAKSP